MTTPMPEIPLHYSVTALPVAGVVNPHILAEQRNAGGPNRHRMGAGTYMVQASWDGPAGCQMLVQKGAAAAVVVDEIPSGTAGAPRTTRLLKVTSPVVVDLFFRFVASPTAADVSANHAVELTVYPIGAYKP